MGHGLSSMLFGGGSRAEPEAAQAQQQQAPAAMTEFAQDQSRAGLGCEAQSKDFLRCLEATGNNMESCSFYLEQLKQCQAAARPF